MKSIGLPTASEEPIYTVIDSDWKNIQANKSFGNPNIEDILQSIFNLKNFNYLLYMHHKLLIHQSN